MSNLEFTPIPLPDLTDPTVYPTVTHGPSCSDVPPDDKSCHLTPMTRLREFALPTVDLGKLKFQFANLRELIPAPPSVGVHCPTIEIDQSEAGQTLVGDSASAQLSVSQKNGDACLPKLLGRFVFPCTSIEPSVTVTEGFPVTASWAPPVNVRDNNTCIQQLSLLLQLPGCTTITSSGNSVEMVADPTTAGITRTITDESGSVGQCLTNIQDVIKVPCVVPIVTTGLSITPSTAGSGSLVSSTTGDTCNRRIHLQLNLALAGGGGGSTSGGGFVVGTPSDHARPFGSSCCSSGYAPGAEVPIIDARGVLGTAGAQIDPVSNRIINFTDEMLVTGDTVDLVMQDLAPDPRQEWAIV